MKEFKSVAHHVIEQLFPAVLWSSDYGQFTV